MIYVTTKNVLSPIWKKDHLIIKEQASIEIFIIALYYTSTLTDVTKLEKYMVKLFVTGNQTELDTIYEFMSPIQDF